MMLTMTTPLLLGDVLQYIFGPLLFLLSLFLVLLVLVQRGRGGGLAGALGGMGGQSAFGSKAGDMFTRITVVVASIWFLLCCLAIACLNPQERVPPPAQPTLNAADGGAGATGTTTPDAGSDTKTGEKKTTDSSKATEKSSDEKAPSTSPEKAPGTDKKAGGTSGSAGGSSESTGGESKTKKDGQ